MINIPNYIREKIKQYNPELDTREGSVLRDFLINPLVSILEPYQQEHLKILEQMSLADINDLNEDQMNAIAATFLLERRTGTKAVGYVKFYYNSPRSITIPKGLSLISNNITFKTTSDYFITKAQMESDLSQYPYYVTENIQVVADDYGVTGNLEANSQFKVVGQLSSTPVKIINVEAFSGGTDIETNYSLYNRIKNTIHGKSLASSTAIKETITDNFNDVIDVEVIGAGHPLMTRDLTYYIQDVEKYKSIDFLYTYSGMHNGEYDSKHMAFSGNFLDLDETSDVQFPSITGWTHEFSNDMYRGIYKLYDMNYAQQDQYTLIREDWGDTFYDPLLSNNPDLQMILASGQWQIHDGAHPDNTLFYLNEFGIVNNKLRMGKTLSPEAASAVAIPLAQISGIYEMLLSGEEQQIEDAQLQLFNYISPSTFNNLSPIIHKPIDQHLGIEIFCEMMTTDNTEDGEMAYITVLRNSEIFLPHDGFGIAWRKQPEFLLRMDRNWSRPAIAPLNTGGQGTVSNNSNIYYTVLPDSAYKAADLLKFREIYGYTPNITGPGYVKSHPELWRYNVYLVDNDILQENVWVGYDQLWDQTSGKNQFLQAAKVWIEPEITYQFKIKIYQNMGVEAWIFDLDNPPNDPYANVNKVIDRGQTYPPYLPQSGDKIQTDAGFYILESSRNHFGIAVSETRNCEWYVDNLLVKTFSETFPMHLFRMKPDLLYFDPNKAAQVNYYGVGFDPEQFLLNGETGHSKVKVGVYNTQTEAWEIGGTNTATINDTRDKQKISVNLNPLLNYLDAEGYVNIAATAANSGVDFPNDTDHTLRSYYIEMNNVLENGVHRGNAVDVYVHDPKNIKLGTITVIMPGSTINLSTIQNIQPYIVEIVDIKEGISKVTFDKSSYTINSFHSSKSYSDNIDISISFDIENMENTLIEITYYYWANGPLVNALINDPDFRYPASDIMIKAMPPTIVTINKLEYSGGLNTEEMKLKIVNYFNTLNDTRFDVSDLINVMYENGATYVNTDMDISVREYNTTYEITQTSLTGSFYSIDPNNISRFFTNINELYGVIQL